MVALRSVVRLMSTGLSYLTSVAEAEIILASTAIFYGNQIQGRTRLADDAHLDCGSLPPLVGRLRKCTAAGAGWDGMAVQVEFGAAPSLAGRPPSPRPLQLREYAFQLRKDIPAKWKTPTPTPRLLLSRSTRIVDLRPLPTGTYRDQ